MRQKDFEEKKVNDEHETNVIIFRSEEFSTSFVATNVENLSGFSSKQLCPIMESDGHLYHRTSLSVTTDDLPHAAFRPSLQGNTGYHDDREDAPNP